MINIKRLLFAIMIVIMFCMFVTGLTLLVMKASVSLAMVGSAVGLVLMAMAIYITLEETH